MMIEMTSLFNLSSDNGSGFLNQATDKINANAGLAPLANNGGLTQSHALLSGSAALDAGKNFGADSDQRGAARVFDIASLANAAGGDGSDIGAFETQAQIVSNANDAGTGSLRQAISNAQAFMTGCRSPH